MAAVTAKSTRKRSILRQFLTPVLLAVLMTGLGIAVISKWAADRSSRIASAMRMNSIGQIIAQSSYPKTSNVLENLKTLTRLEFILLRKPDSAGGNERANTSVEQATFKLTSDQLARIEQVIFYSDELWNRTSTSSPQLMGELEAERVALRWSAFHSDNHWLVVLEPEAVRGDGWFVFALPLVTGLLSSIGIAFVAAWTARKLSKRIESLETEVSDIAVGKFIRRPLEGPGDAIQSLQSSLYSMGEELEESKRQIEVNERTRLIHMIGSGLAHELRNHLAGARLALQTVEASPADSEAIEICVNQLDLAETQIRRLLAIRPGGDAIDSAPLTVQAILASVVEFASPIAAHHKVQLDVFSPPPSTRDLVSTILSEQVSCGASIVGVLLNVVLNGIEAVSGSDQLERTAGIVQLTTNYVLTETSPNRLSPKVQWLVRDNGPGPSPLVAQSMFEPFATTKREGVGLGLAMCKHVVESTGGSIQWIRTDGWTEFEIHTPIAAQLVSPTLPA